MKRKSILLSYICIVVLLFAACKSSRNVTAPPAPKANRYLSSKLQVVVPGGGGSMRANGTMKLLEGSRVQISVLMPIIRAEIARIDVTPEDVLLIDRMNKRYVRATRKELAEVLPKNADFAALEKLLFAASLPNGKAEMSGNDLGIPLLENTRVKLYDFSTDPFVINPIEVSDKYSQVPLPVLLKMLSEL